MRKLPCVVNLFLAVIFIELTGCTSSPLPTLTEDVLSSVNTIAVSDIQQAQPATQMPSGTPSPTFTSTNTSTSTPTFVPTIPPTEMTTATIPIIPTPPGIEVTEKVLWLFETNNGCQLPCWWGIVPGQTSWNVAEQFFHTFAPIIYETSNPELINYSPVIPLPLNVFGVRDMTPVYTVYNGVVEVILTTVSIGDTPTNYLNAYTLPAFLTTYGQPSEVWLFTYATPVQHDDLPFFLALFYPDKGIVALYSDNGARQDDIVQGCPQEDPVKTLLLWSPARELTFEQVRGGVSAFNSEYRPLEEVTEIDAASFYTIFQQTGNTTCLETPAKFWR